MNTSLMILITYGTPRSHADSLTSGIVSALCIPQLWYKNTVPVSFGISTLAPVHIQIA
jgi:hypothetical protein